MSPSALVDVDFSDEGLINSLEKYRGCDVLLVLEKPKLADCSENVVYIYQEKELTSSEPDSELGSDSGSESDFLQKTETVKLKYCVKKKKDNGFDEDNLDDLPDDEKQGIKSRFPKLYGANRLYDAKQRKAVFEKTRANNHTQNEQGILTLFQTLLEDVAAGLKALYPLDKASESTVNNVQKNTERRKNFLKMLEEVQYVYDALMHENINSTSYFFSHYAKELAVLKENLEEDEKKANRKKHNKKVPQNFSDILFGEAIKKWNSRENKSTKFSMGLYALFSTTSFATAVAALAAPLSTPSACLSHAMATHITATVWDDADTSTGSVSAYNQYLQGEEKVAFWNAFGQAQMFASTALACLAIDLYFSPVVALPALAVSSLLGFSLAIAMLVPIYIERYAEKKCEEELEVIRNKKTILNDEKTEKIKDKETCMQSIANELLFCSSMPQNITIEKLKDPIKKEEIKEVIQNIQNTEEAPTRKKDLQEHFSRLETLEVDEKELQSQIDTLERAEVLIELERKHHQRNKKEWTGIAVAMAVVTVACFLTLSTVTVGAVPAAMVVATGIAFLTVFAKTLYVENKKRQDYQKAIQTHGTLFGLSQKNKIEIPSKSTEVDIDDSSSPLIIKGDSHLQVITI